MKDYLPAMSFDRESARRDARYERGDEAAAVGFLASIADGGPVLELGVGTGRLALPLGARGVRVDGIDISPHMVEQLRARPGGSEIGVTVGDFADVAVDGTYRLVFVAFNTFFNLLTQAEQVRCFENVAAHLAEDGVFVMEAYSPAFLYRLDNDQYVRTESIEIDEVRIDLVRHDPTTQTIEESHVTLSSSGTRLNPVVQRYAWPAELDLMARIAGLELTQRWGGWNGEPFVASGESCVSVWRRPE